VGHVEAAHISHALPDGTGHVDWMIARDCWRLVAAR